MGCVLEWPHVVPPLIPRLQGGFAMARLREITWSDDAFESLVLGSTQKRLIHALVSEHAKQRSDFDDVIQGKGRGLIGLLAGSPGCGKTLTAEAVAETTRRPLYAVSAGEQSRGKNQPRQGERRRRGSCRRVQCYRWQSSEHRRGHSAS